MFPSETAFDRALGIDTSLTDRSWSDRRRHPCQPTPLAALEVVAERLSSENHVVDFGCGTGRAVFYLAHAAKCRVTGVELDERHYSAAEENLSRCAKKVPATAARIRFVNAPAQNCPLDESVDAVYCFNPFPAAVLRGVLQRVEESLAECPREIRMFCYYPDDEWVELLTAQGWTLTESVSLQKIMGKDSRERVDIFRK